MALSDLSVAFLFPGQGSQSVGMGRSMFENDHFARARFEQADGILGRDLSRLCFEGPEEELRNTRNQQPALFVCSAAACDVLRKTHKIEPMVVTGHSLGEYGALYAAGALDFETALRLVAARGDAMARSAQATPGSMAAILGPSVSEMEKVCEQASTPTELVVVANDNCPGQTVISGASEAVNRACALATEAGAKKAVVLPVSGAFHSPLVDSARREMAELLGDIEIRAPRCAFLSSSTGLAISDVETIRSGLVEQVTGRVRWMDTYQKMAKMGVCTALEVGPGKVLAGLGKRIDKGSVVLPCGTLDDIAASLQVLAALEPPSDVDVRPESKTRLN